MHKAKFMIMNVDFMYPIGSIYFSVNSTNPSKWFGGTWVSWGTGRVPVGVDTSQTEFNTVEKTGGSKYLQSHKHEGLAWWGDFGSQSISLNAGGVGGYNLSYSGTNRGGNEKYAIQTANAGDGNSGNLQPYITCYMWKRTA